MEQQQPALRVTDLGKAMYRQITVDERYTLGLLRQLGYPVATIAQVLGRARSTVWREVRRNRANSDGTYRPQLAEWYARRPPLALAGAISASPRPTGSRCTPGCGSSGAPSRWPAGCAARDLLRISHETIYRHIWADKRAGGTLHTHLRGARKQCRKRYGYYDRRGRLAGKRSITRAPADRRGRASRIGRLGGGHHAGAPRAIPTVC